MLDSLKRILRLMLAVFIMYLSVVMMLGALYSAVPPVSTLMLARWATLQPVARLPVSLPDVSRQAVRAVVAAEDAQFCEHWGVDSQSMEYAIERGWKGKKTFGASTISMQVAKNLFLWPQRSYVRKALEVPIALYLELIWSKRRMMEVYLSVAEWGEGVFGIEAASQVYYRKSSYYLTSLEGAMLASALPNPKERNPAKPSAYQRDYASTILRRMNVTDLRCLSR